MAVESDPRERPVKDREGQGAVFAAELLAGFAGDQRDAVERLLRRWSGRTLYLPRPDRGEGAERRVACARLQLAAGAGTADAARIVARQFRVSLRTAQADVQRAQWIQERLRTGD